MEADQRQVDTIIDRLNSTTANGVKTAWEEEKAWELENNQEELKFKEARFYREIVARGNYLAQDRPATQYSVKELCRDMCKPTK